MSTPPHYQELTVFGPFKRIIADGKQTPSDMTKIIRSGELWGGPPAYGLAPAAQGYRGTLLEGERGFDFYASTAPDNKWGPPYWRERADGSVWLEDEKAKVKIYISRVTMAFESNA
jgi:hypothetical protein